MANDNSKVKDREHKNMTREESNALRDSFEENVSKEREKRLAEEAKRIAKREARKAQAKATEEEPADPEQRMREQYVDHGPLCAKHFDLLRARSVDLGVAVPKMIVSAFSQAKKADKVCCAIGDGGVNDIIQGRRVRNEGEIEAAKKKAG